MPWTTSDIRSFGVSSELRTGRRAETGRRFGTRRPGRSAAAAMLAAILVFVAACGSAAPSTIPTTYTAVPIGPTAWPSGTVGQYGLRIDPSLLSLLPASVAALPLQEDAASEAGALGDKDLPNNFDGYAAAAIGIAGNDPDWLNLVIARRKASAQTPDFYVAWVEDFATGACSQANGVANSAQQTINGWTVDVSTCNGGPVVYTLSLDESVLVSMWGMGPRDLGRKLIENLH